MQISHVPGVTRVGEITLNGKEYKGKKHVFYKRKLALDYDANFPKELSQENTFHLFIFSVLMVRYTKLDNLPVVLVSKVAWISISIQVQMTLALTGSR